jgi:hypothetical protein
MARRLAMTLMWLALLMGRMAAQESSPATAPLSDDLQPHIIGTKGVTLIGFGGFVDRVYSSERLLPLNYTMQIDVGRFVSKRVVIRGGVFGSSSAGGDDEEDRPTGLGAPALRASGGLFYYFTPLSMWSPYGGAEYSTQLTQRAAGDRGAVLGTLGLEGAVSRRVGIFFEAGYGLGLTGPDERTTRLTARAGVRLKF